LHRIAERIASDRRLRIEGGETPKLRPTRRSAPSTTMPHRGEARLRFAPARGRGDLVASPIDEGSIRLLGEALSLLDA
jgi:hypothetical protein